MMEAALSTDRKAENFVLCALVFLALLMSVKYFPGIEATGAYAGNVFQAIHPDAFPGDPFIGAERSIWEKPLQLSLFYLLPRIMGEIWLDDRFAFVVYLLLVLIGMVGVDRIVKLCGVAEIAPRLIVQLVFMRDHQYLTTMTTFANQPDLNYGAFEIPAAIWLIYVTLARKSLWVILTLCALLAAITIKMAPLVIAFCLIIAAFTGGFRDRIVVVAVFAVALAVFVYAAIYVFPVPAADRLVLWDLTLNDVEKFDINPFFPRPDFMGTLARNVVFVAILVGALLAPVPASLPLRGMKVYVGLGLFLWLVAGVYFSFAPDVFKLIHAMPFSPARSLRWPQTLAYIVIMVSLFVWLRDHRRWRDLAGATLVFAILLVVGPANHELWAALFVVSAVAALGAYALHQGIGGQPAGRGSIAFAIANRYPILLAQALALTIGIAFTSTIWKNSSYWQPWAAHGVYGNSPVVQWIGIAEYLRRNTPADAVVLALEEETEGFLNARRHLASRSGRTIATVDAYTSIFDLGVWHADKQRQNFLDQLGEAVIKGNGLSAVSALESITPRPDYFVIPARYTGATLLRFLPFVEETRIGDYAILKRKPASR